MRCSLRQSAGMRCDRRRQILVRGGPAIHALVTEQVRLIAAGIAALPKSSGPAQDPSCERRSGNMGTASAALFASSETTSAQTGGEAARNKDILAREYQ